MSDVFEVFDMTRQGDVEPKSTDFEADALSTTPPSHVMRG